MFTGIIETVAQLKEIKKEHTNIHFVFESSLATELKIDQSLSHNGVCLTVVSIKNNTYTVTAIKETLDKTNLGGLRIHDYVNLERCTKIGDRLDGHIVQGHVDTTAICSKIEDFNGSKKFYFTYDSSDITVEKGSITINGTSLTVIDSEKNGFSVALIPYTISHTTFKYLKIGDRVNLEFDIIGKYVTKLLTLRS